jgi:hypothetical protein
VHRWTALGSEHGSRREDVILNMDDMNAANEYVVEDTVGIRSGDWKLILNHNDDG